MGNSINKKFNILRLVLYFVLIEIVIGGSGRMLEFGALSLKMLLFGIAMLLTFFNAKKIILDKSLFFLEAFFLLLTLFSLSMGFFSNSELENIFEDIKPLIFIIIINFFIITIDSTKTIDKVTSIIKYSSAFMAIIYIMIVLMLFLGILNFDVFYEGQSENSEVMFRNEYMFFYKGFLYLGVGFLFLILSNKKIDQILSVLVFSALCLTLTRGFILMSILVYIFYIYFINKKIFLKIFISVIGISLAIYLLPIFFETLGDKSDSDVMRFITFNQVIDEMTLFSFLFGHGFGHGVESRPIHMEISFLEIFHKQGIIGISFWLYLLYLNFKYYFKIKSKNYKRLVLPFLLSVCFTYLQSLTNPFINNPIGISIIMLSTVVLYKLTIFEKKNIHKFM
ncbi:hypothetical protein HXZ62_13320 [Empedobacter falsenii]|uniref:hypothetical protein n=1 Tax=Empedobacter TaxID=59734 RepID=UPI002576E5C6|nr:MULTISPECIES: hypothetical protein [Empedobacter]MDM1063532.1 hypothetical protein [Empedobacter falsenii]